MNQANACAVLIQRCFSVDFLVRLVYYGIVAVEWRPQPQRPSSTSSSYIKPWQSRCDLLERHPWYGRCPISTSDILDIRQKWDFHLSDNSVHCILSDMHIIPHLDLFHFSVHPPVCVVHPNTHSGRQNPKNMGRVPVIQISSTWANCNHLAGHRLLLRGPGLSVEELLCVRDGPHARQQRHHHRQRGLPRSPSDTAVGTC